jgi:division protein CdvB (Snf7/Vps24/ESCRT-III family)
MLARFVQAHRVADSKQNACKILAKDLVRTRRYIQKFTQMRVQLQAVSLRMQTLRSNEQMAGAMKGATRVSLLCCLGRVGRTSGLWDNVRGRMRAV